jgi:uncharacterized membrane protein YbhN (UPF0104 family)
MSPRVLSAARWLVALAVLVFVLSRVDLGALGARLSGANLALALPAIAGLVASQLVAAAAWRSLLRRLAGVHLTWPATIRLHYAAQAIGAVTPGNLGADVYRVAAVDAEAGRARLALPIIVQRLTSIAALLVLGGVGAMALPIVGGLTTLVAVALIALGVVGAPVAVLAWFRLRGNRPGPGTWAPVLRDGLGLGLVFHVLGIGLAYVLVLAVDGTVAARSLEVLAALAVARVSLAVPLSPNGLGLQEGALALLFTQLGLAPEIALAALVLNRVAMLATIVIGAAALSTGGAAGKIMPVATR